MTAFFTLTGFFGVGVLAGLAVDWFCEQLAGTAEHYADRYP